MKVRLAPFTFIVTICVSILSISSLGGCTYPSRYVYQPEKYLRYAVPTADGLTVSLSRLSRSVASTLPVLLIPEAGFSSAIFAAPDGLAEALSLRGYDVWLLDPRGVGRSSRPHWSDAGTGVEHNWSLADYATLDIPAAIERIVSVTGAASVPLIGHGFGGSGALLASLRKGISHLGPVVAIAPLVFNKNVSDFELQLIALESPLLESGFAGETTLDLGEALRAPAFVRRDGSIFDLILGGDRLPAELKNTILGSAGKVSIGIALDYLSILKQSRAILAEMKNIKVRTLIIGGFGDYLALPEDLIALVHVLPNTPTYREFSVTNYDGEDFGHLGLVAGEGARTRVAPFIDAWLKGINK